MKANPLRWLLLFLLLNAASELPAQQSEADRKLLADIRAKAEKGDAQSQYDLGNAFAVGRLGVAKDEVEAVKWFRKAAEQNYADAQYNLGCCYCKGQGVAKDEAVAVKWFRKSAEQNYPDAQFNLGCCYCNGLGVVKDEAEAVKWFRRAAEQNFAAAQYNLGKCYADGLGVVKDEPEAVKWFRKAAEQNHADAQNNLGGCYQNGQGVAKNEVEAAKLFRKAAEQGDAGGQYNLANSYHYGVGVPTNHTEAAKWYQQAADQGFAMAQMGLGRLYQDGEGVVQDYAEAAKWFGKGANQGDAMAQTFLGALYLSGKGVPQNDIEAYKWLNLAASQNFQDAFQYRDIVRNRMTPEEVAESQRRAALFTPRVEPEPHTADFGARTSPQLADGPPRADGTGFFITPDGFLITNEHVVKDSSHVRLVTEAGLISAKVVKVDSANDLALLKAEGRFAVLAVASSRTVKMGSTVATVGFPNIGLQGFAPKLAKGEIAALSGANDDPRYFQISVPLQPGNSGGALVDERGDVVGVVAAKLSAAAAVATSGALPENVNYAVKSSLLLSFLESVPEVAAKLKQPEMKERKFEDVVKSAEQAAVLVLVY